MFNKSMKLTVQRKNGVHDAHGYYYNVVMVQYTKLVKCSCPKTFID